MTSNKECIFCKIAAKEINADFVYEDDELVAFKDIAPKARVHILLTPKKHITSLNSLTPEHKELISSLMLEVPTVAQILGIKDSGYRVIVNVGKNSGQIVDHLHVHILGGERMAKGL